MAARKGTSPDGMINIDGVLAATSGLAKLSMQGLEFESLGKDQ